MKPNIAEVLSQPLLKSLKNSKQSMYLKNIPRSRD